VPAYTPNTVRAGTVTIAGVAFHLTQGRSPSSASGYWMLLWGD
jgi:hypothetical protein